MNKGMFTAKKIAVLAVLTALSLITFIIENLFPPLFFPGAKMGLANTFSFIALVMYSPLEAFIIVGVRTLLGAVFAGNVSALLYSFTGGVVAMAISSALFYLAHPKISIMSVSVAAAVAHNITQIIVFVLLTGSALMFGYMPYFALLGIVSGAIVGGVALLVIRKMPMNVFEKVIKDRESKKSTAATAGEAKSETPLAEDRTTPDSDGSTAQDNRQV